MMALAAYAVISPMKSPSTWHSLRQKGIGASKDVQRLGYMAHDLTEPRHTTRDFNYRP